MKPRHELRAAGGRHRLVVTALASVAIVLTAAAGLSGREVVLFDGPRGAWLGTFKEGAPLVVLEEKDGWRHIRLEGWVMTAAADSAAEGAMPPPPPGASTPATAETARGAIVQGILAAPMGSAGGAGGGVLTLLVRESESLDREHKRMGEECRARLAKADGDLEALRLEANRALNSSDNFREATQRSDQAKSRIARGQRERWNLVQECRARAQDLFEGSVAQRAISDGNGRFEFRDVEPGRYRVVAFETSGESPRAWSLDLTAATRGTQILDPGADRSAVPADWGLR